MFKEAQKRQTEPQKKQFMTNSNENTYLQKNDKILKTSV